MSKQDSSINKNATRLPGDDPGRFLIAFGCMAASLLVIAFGAAVLLWRTLPGPEVAKEPEHSPHDDSVARLVDAEEWILEQTPKLDQLTAGLSSGKLPDPNGAKLFSDNLQILDLDDSGELVESANSSPDQSTHVWKLQSQSSQIAKQDILLWRPLLQGANFLHAKFFIIDAHYADNEQRLIESTMGFDGLAQDQDGEMLVVQATQKVSWKNATESGGGEVAWQITQWRQQSLQTIGRKRQMYRDVTHEALSADLIERLRMSQHERLLIDMVQNNTPEPYKYFSVYSNGRHPSLSVVDIDNDGLDDLYVMSRIGKNLLLKNQGDGTFRDIAADVGLDLEGFCSSAMFADFDNDGDPDLMLGRTLRRSRFYVNEGGRFVNKSKDLVETALPYLVYSLSVADYNGDGLLDVFFATGAQHISTREQGLMTMRGSPFAESKMMFREFLTNEKAKKAFEQRENHGILARVGPPNLLLVNRGGRFEVAPENEQLEIWRTTTQGTWADFDNDGDPDLYLSNDYSINTLFRNDGDDGFTDITAETRTGDIGFGMGVSWGDYDNNGRLDLYVSNMYSKAGRRITAQVDKLDQRFANMARGNTLFKNTPDSLDKVSGVEAPSLLVEKAGWSWGSQFVDVNNDGFLDIYALSGFYTAPEEVAIKVDL